MNTQEERVETQTETVIPTEKVEQLPMDPYLGSTYNEIKRTNKYNAYQVRKQRDSRETLIRLLGKYDERLNKLREEFMNGVNEVKFQGSRQEAEEMEWLLQRLQYQVRRGDLTSGRLSGEYMELFVRLP